MSNRWPTFASCTFAVAFFLWTDAHAPPPHGPDLIVDRPRLESDWTVGLRFIPPGDCTIVEGCVLAPGFGSC